MLIDFQPKYVTPLRYWVHAILPLVYEDSLSYYEVLAKISQKMNEVIESLNKTVEKVDEITDFVNDSIKNLTEEFNKFKEDMTARQDKFEADITKDFNDFKNQLDGELAEWEANVEENIQNFETKINNDFTNLTNQLDTNLETWENETYNTLVQRIDELIEEYKVNVVQTTGQSTTDVMSQKAVTDALASVGSGVNVVQTTGQSTTDVMSQKAVTDALASGGGSGINVVQTEGQSTTDVMSQKAVTDGLNNVTQTLEEEINNVKIDISQTTGDSTTSVMSQKAVTDALASAGSSVNVVQTTGQSTTDVMSQKAVTDALASGGGSGINVVQTEGQSTTDVMSQKAVTDTIDSVQQILDEKIISNKTTIVQNTGDSTTSVMSQKAVTDALASATGVNVVQTTGQSETDVMSQKAVTDTIDTAKQDLQTKIDESKINVVQATGQSETDVMSQKAVSDELTKITETTTTLREDLTAIEESVVQTTGESAVDVMSQKAVTDELNNIKEQYVAKAGDIMTGDLTVPTVHGNLDGNATTSNIPLGFIEKTDEIPVIFQNTPVQLISTWVAPANTNVPVPVEQYDNRKLSFCIAPGNQLYLCCWGGLYQRATGYLGYENRNILAQVLDTSELTDGYINTGNTAPTQTTGVHGTVYNGKYINNVYGKRVHLTDSDIHILEGSDNAIRFPLSTHYIDGSYGFDVTFAWRSEQHPVNNLVHIIRYPNSKKIICDGFISEVGVLTGLSGAPNTDYAGETVASIMVSDSTQGYENDLLMYFDTAAEVSSVSVEGIALVNIDFILHETV